MVRISTEARFETAHRQFNDPGKCGRLHGHNWVVVFAIEGEIKKGGIGYLIDFKDLKNLVGVYDHTVLLHKDDPLVGVLRSAGQIVVAMDENPTAEFLADEIAMGTKILLEEQDINWKKVEITVWENNKSAAGSELFLVKA